MLEAIPYAIAVVVFIEVLYKTGILGRMLNLTEKNGR